MYEMIESGIKSLLSYVVPLSLRLKGFRVTFRSMAKDGFKLCVKSPGIRYKTFNPQGFSSATSAEELSKRDRGRKSAEARGKTVYKWTDLSLLHQMN